jgi:hypothetical protein
MPLDCVVLYVGEYQPEAGMRFGSVFTASLAIGLAISAQPEARQGILSRQLPSMSFDNKSLPEVAKLLSNAARVKVTLAPDIQECIAKQKTGSDEAKRGPCCDWSISADWRGKQSLENALGIVTASANLSYRVVDQKTIQITMKAPTKEPSAP